MAGSRAEAEYKVLSQGILEGLWLKRLLGELRIPMEETMRIMCDNLAAISIAKNLACPP